MKQIVISQRVGRWLCTLAVLACPLFGADKAAVVEIAQGDVSVIKDNGPWALFDGDSVSVGQTITTGSDEPCCTDRDGNGIPPFPKR